MDKQLFSLSLPLIMATNHCFEQNSGLPVLVLDFYFPADLSTASTIL
ncbi:MAG: hypothetical protein KAS69_00895 [Planctomycetes bacterium]|nr:hypothetical protein [Planctomycetota bacterium]